MPGLFRLRLIRRRLDVMDSNVTRVVRATTADLIATTWFGLGFRPRQSLVLTGLAGPRHLLRTTVRIDLPDATIPRSSRRQLIGTCLDTVQESPADRLLAIVFSEAALAQPQPQIVPLIWQEMSRRLPVHDIVGVTSTGYRSLICLDEQCCPRAGLPIEKVLSSRAALAHVLNGDLLAGSEQELLADVRAETETKEDEPADHELSPGERQHWWWVWATALAAETSGADRGTASVAGLSGALHDGELRDTVLMDLLGGAGPQLAAMLDGEAALALRGLRPGEQHLAGLLATPPDSRRLAEGEAVVVAAARAAPPGDRAPALAVLAMLAWYQGRGARSRMLVQEARDDCPDMSLAQLVDDLLRTMTKPPWMRKREIRY